MDAFFNKLDNLAFEILGVLVPGLIATTFIGLLWMALGPLIPLWTYGTIPELTPAGVVSVVNRTPGASQVFPLISVVMTCYLLGHSVSWSSRVRSEPATLKETLVRTWGFLTFRPQKPGVMFDDRLKPQLTRVMGEFSRDEPALVWAQFYPIAKNFIMNSGRNSLLSTYQNKYTLHVHCRRRLSIGRGHL